MTDDGRDVTGAFARPPERPLRGPRHRPRASARNELVASADGADAAAQLTITNHPNGGPVFSGPQVAAVGLPGDGAPDEQCNQPAEYELRSTSPRPTAQLHAVRPGEPARATSRTTTTDQGETVPFIVRIETGYQDRDQYKIAVLYDPAQPWEPWAPQEQWNHKLLITHGASCGIDHQSGAAPSVTGDTVHRRQPDRRARRAASR